MAARASGDAASSPSGPGEGPIAVVAICGAGVADPAALFSRRESDVAVVASSARTEIPASVVGPTRLEHLVDGASAALEVAASDGVPLVVLLASVAEQGVSVGIVFRSLERELFETLSGALARSANARAAIRSGRLRVAAALVEEPARRVHWLGEHPELARLLAAGS
ncbi:MAG: hypothetical protein ACKO0W_02060 [Planctomycetota bacterium]